jgi:DNA-binding MarR family transcriptional regulator
LKPINPRPAHSLDAETKAAERPGRPQGRAQAVAQAADLLQPDRGEVRRRLAAEFAVTLPRFDLLAQLDKAPDGLTLGETSRRMMVSNANVTSLVERLVADGLIVRRTDPRDRRASYISLTPRRAHRLCRHGARPRAVDRRTVPRPRCRRPRRPDGLLGKTKASVRRATANGAKP